MGRTATFDRADAVRAARGVFWNQGYEATSIPDLEQATGLKRSSLYHAFESKKGLFDEVVENYLAESVRPLLARITSEEAKPDALNDYFATLASSISSTDRHPGCLLIAAANGPVGTDPVVSAAISGYYDELFATFRAGLGRARPHLTEAETGSQARTLVALTISALALARTNKTLALANLQAAQALLAVQDYTKRRRPARWANASSASVKAGADQAFCPRTFCSRRKIPVSTRESIMR